MSQIAAGTSGDRTPVPVKNPDVAPGSDGLHATSRQQFALPAKADGPILRNWKGYSQESQQRILATYDDLVEGRIRPEPKQRPPLVGFWTAKINGADRIIVDDLPGGGWVLLGAVFEHNYDLAEQQIAGWLAWKKRTRHSVKVASDYWMSHRPTEDGPPAHDLLATDMLPPDVYDKPHFYTGFREMLPETMATLRAARGKPDALVTIYRSVPPGVTSISTGDWVTLSKAYALGHGVHADDPSQDAPVISARVPASTVRHAGDDMMEWGYWGPSTTGRKTAAKQPPATLYHYTSPMHLPYILRDGHLRTTESNIDYLGRGPRVVWLTDTPTGDGNGTYGDKGRVRLTVRPPTGRTHHWPTWSRDLGIEDFWYEALEKAAGDGASAESWWVVTGEIPLSWVTKIEVDGREVPKDQWVALRSASAADPTSDASRWRTAALEMLAGANGSLPNLTYRMVKPNVLVAVDADETDPRLIQHGIGQISWGPDGKISWVQVFDEEYQRRGMATWMFEQAKKIEPRLHHSEDLNESSRPWARSMGHVAGANGDLPEDLTFEHRTHAAGQGMGFGPERSVVAMLDGQKVGELYWHDEPGSSRDKMIEWVFVPGRFGRRGIATALLAEARKVDPAVRHSDVQGMDGRAWARAVASHTAAHATAKTAAAGRWFHIADKADFRLDPRREPNLNRTLPTTLKPGIFLTRDPEQWGSNYGYRRPFIVEFDVPAEAVAGGIEGTNEIYVPAEFYPQMRIVKVHTWDGYVRDRWRSEGPVEGETGVDHVTGEPLTVKGTQPMSLDPWYEPPGPGVDARSIPADRLRQYVKDFKAWRRKQPKGFMLGSKTAGAYDPIERTVVLGGDTFVLTYDPLRPITKGGSRSIRAGLGSAGGREAGYLTWFSDHTIADVGVQPPFQRRGLATAMLAMAREIVPDLRHSHALTPDGKAWSEKVGLKIAALPAGLSIEEEWDLPSIGPSQRAVAARIDGRLVGGLLWNTQDGIIDYIQVDADQRRQGIATALFEAARRLDPNVRHDVEDKRSEVGKEWVRSLAMAPSWRDYGERPEAEALIAPDTGRGRRNSFEVFLYGQPHARRSTLAEAKATVEEIYGPQTWKRLSGDEKAHHDRVHGWTTMFNDADYYLVVRRLPRLGATSGLDRQVLGQGRPSRPGGVLAVAEQPQRQRVPADQGAGENEQGSGDQGSVPSARGSAGDQRGREAHVRHASLLQPPALGEGDAAAERAGHAGSRQASLQGSSRGGQWPLSAHRRAGSGDTTQEGRRGASARTGPGVRGQHEAGVQDLSTRGVGSHLIAAYGDTLIARGLKVYVGIDSFTDKIPALLSGRATARDILDIVDNDGVGIWWGVMGSFGDLADFEDYAYSDGLLADTYEDLEGGDVSVVLIGKRPQRDGAPWDPEIHNPAEAGGLMGNSYLQNGEQVDLVEIRYNAGQGWKSLPAQGLRTTAMIKTADEDQCPYDGSDSMPDGEGHYRCEDGHRWHPDEPAARRYHGDGPDRGKIQPLAAVQVHCDTCGVDYFIDSEDEKHDHAKTAGSVEQAQRMWGWGYEKWKKVGPRTMPFPVVLPQQRPWDKDAVLEQTKPSRRRFEVFDPRDLIATQMGITWHGVQYYATSDEYRRSGKTYADQHLPSNEYPIFYQDSLGVRILTGHHRAVAALLNGEKIRAVIVEGPDRAHTGHALALRGHAPAGEHFGAHREGSGAGDRGRGDRSAARGGLGRGGEGGGRGDRLEGHRDVPGGQRTAVTAGRVALNRGVFAHSGIPRSLAEDLVAGRARAEQVLAYLTDGRRNRFWETDENWPVSRAQDHAEMEAQGSYFAEYLHKPPFDTDDEIDGIGFGAVISGVAEVGPEEATFMGNFGEMPPGTAVTIQRLWVKVSEQGGWTELPMSPRRVVTGAADTSIPTEPIVEFDPAVEGWRPTGGMFARGQETLDPRLFDADRMRPEVQSTIMATLDAYWKPKYGAWQDWARVYLAGSGASYWWDSDADLDILIGIDLERLRQARPANREVSDAEVLAALNAGLQTDLRPTTTTLLGFETTWFCNPGAYDIRAIHPYAAYDVGRNEWVVHPPVLPANWGPESIPESIWRRCEQVAREAREVLTLPEPERSIAGTVLFNWIKDGRRAAYSEHGGGWLDAGNVIYQYLTQHPQRLLRRLYLCKHPEKPAHAEGIERTAAKDEWKQIEGLRWVTNKRKVTCFAPETDAISQVAGKISWYPDGEIWMVVVNERYRRMGLATELLRRAREVDPRVHHSTTLTEDGKAWSGKVAARSRGLDYAQAWSANQPEFWVVGNAAPQIGGDWEGHVTLARGSMTYEQALNPTAFVDGLMTEAHRRIREGEVYARGGQEVTTLYLVTRGRGRDGMNSGGASWVVGEASVGKGQFRPTTVTLRGEYGRTAKPSPRLMNAMMYSSGEEARKWIGENLAGVVTDESMFADLAQTVTVYRGISLKPGDDPWSSLNDNGGVGSSWTVNLDTAKAIAERGRAGFTSGGQVMGDTYSVDPDRPTVPTVLRAEVTLLPPEQNGPAPYRPWTIDYASEAEIDIPRGTEVVLNGYMQAKAVDRGPDPSNPKYFSLVTWRWPSSWKSGKVKRTAAKALPEGYSLQYIRGGNIRNYSVVALFKGQVVGAIQWKPGREVRGSQRVPADNEDGYTLEPTLIKRPPQIVDLKVQPDHRRKGLATAMYEEAKHHEPDLVHDDIVLPDGQAWMRSLSARTAARLPSNLIRSILDGKPWLDRNTEKVLAGEFPGIVMDPSMSAGMAGHSYSSDHLTFSPVWWRTQDEFGRFFTLTHEIGHSVPVNQVQAHPDFAASFGTHVGGGRYSMGNPWGVQENLSEVIADGYSEICLRGVQPVEEGYAPSLALKVIADVAKTAGMPVGQIRQTGSRVAASTIEGLIAEFAADHPDLVYPMAAYDRCHPVSEAFARLCTRNGIRAEVVSGMKMGESDLFPGVKLMVQGHFGVQVGDKVYDWTIRQFDPDADVPKVWTKREWDAEWNSFKSIGSTAGRQGTFWRVHPEGRAFGDWDATSRPFYNHDDQEPQRGYSCFENPWHLYLYVRIQWARLYDGTTVLRFPGEHVGEGHDGEDLAVPTALPFATTWGNFCQMLPQFPFPDSPAFAPWVRQRREYQSWEALAKHWKWLDSGEPEMEHVVKTFARNPAKV